MIRKIFQLSIFLITLLSASGAWAVTYYVDWVTGADTNDGITKTTPWKRAPGMYGCSGNSLAKRNAGGVPGDQFILKGGVTWPRAALSWDWYFGSGTQANPIYFGVDKAWYSGGSWSRPILDAEGGVPNASPEGIKSIMRVYGTWFVVDDFDFKGLAQLDDVNTAPNMLSLGTWASAASEIKNCYFHGWSHGGTATKDYMIIIGTSLLSEGPDMNLKIHDNVFDGSDTTKDMVMVYKGSAGHFYNNYITLVNNGVLGNPKYLWGNTFKDIAVNGTFDATSHMNSIETLGGESVIYNNFFNNTSGGVTIWTENKDGDTDYVFNNVAINDFNQGIQISNYSYTTGTSTGIYIFNNTLQGDASHSYGRICGPSYTGYPYMSFMTVRNNHMISTTNTVNFGRVTTQTQSNNVGMTNTAATSAGYVATGTSPFYPPFAGATVGTGSDLRTLAASIPSSAPSDAATAALSDTTLGVTYDATNHRVIGPNRTSEVRGTTWDVGAYQRVRPSPPENVRIISQ